MKTCTKCERWLPYDEFYRLARGGRRADCRSCVMGQKDERAERFARGEIDAPHGHPSTYANLRCRCDECRAAWSDYQATNLPFARSGSVR